MVKLVSMKWNDYCDWVMKRFKELSIKHTPIIAKHIIVKEFRENYNDFFSYRSRFQQIITIIWQRQKKEKNQVNKNDTFRISDKISK